MIAATALTITFHALADTNRTGLVVMGSYAWVSVKRKSDAAAASQTMGKRAGAGGAERNRLRNHRRGFLFPGTDDRRRHVRIQLRRGRNCFTAVGEPFQSKTGGWIGAKVGLFPVRGGASAEHGYADYDWSRMEKAAQ